jgi:hypothetical protein
MIEENGKYYDRCGDCGLAIKEQKVSDRHNICDECWERRGWLVSMGTKIWNDPRFKKIQSSMAHKTGTAKRQILALQKAMEILNG